MVPDITAQPKLRLLRKCDVDRLFVNQPSGTVQMKLCSEKEAEINENEMSDTTRTITDPKGQSHGAESVRTGGSEELARFTVVIVAYNDIELVRACLVSVLNFSDCSELAEIIIVDNSPGHIVMHGLQPDFSNERIVVSFIANVNRGFGQGNNTGASAASSEFILFLNPDTEFVEPVLDYARAKFLTDSALGLFGMQLVDRNGEARMSYFWVAPSGGIFRGYLLKLAHRRGRFIKGKMFTSGANMFVRRSAFERAGGFDDAIFLYNEERDLTRRVLCAGYKTNFFGERHIIHLEGSGESESIERFRWRLDSLRYYCSKYSLNYRRNIRAELRTERLRRFLGRLHLLSLEDGYSRDKIEVLSSELRR